MAKCKVWNDNTIDHVERFKDDEIRIPAGKYIEMEFFEAHEFKGQYFPPKVDAGGQQTIESMKKIRVEKIADQGEAPAAQEHRCQACAHVSPSPEELEAHVKVRHADAERLELPELDAKSETKGKKKSA